MNPLHELFPPLPPSPEEHRKRILAQLAAENAVRATAQQLGKVIVKGETDENMFNKT